MIEALRVLAGITDATDRELESTAKELGREFPLCQLSVPVGVVIRARKECERVKDPGDSAVSAANIIACAERLVDTGGAPGQEYLALKRAIDNMRGHRSK